MVEVFKTNVKNKRQATQLITQIHQDFGQYVANFDLEDCDRILRIACKKEEICPESIIALLEKHGFWCEVLPDEILPTNLPISLTPNQVSTA
jgi:hypothetical protein